MQKKSLLAAAVLVLASGAALAQSSVTAFGLIDLAARNIKGADSIKYLSNEGRATSRLGFRGVEDLGGGMKAGFHIETQINADDGSVGGNFWQRRATASLMGSFGEVRLGRDKAATRTLIDTFDPFGTSGMPGLNRLITDVDRNRMDNGVMYFLPSMGGVYGSVSMTAGEGANSTSTQRSTSFRLGYKTKAFDVSYANGQFGSSNKLKINAFGGSYDFGGFALMGQYGNFKQGTIDRKLTSVGGTVKLGNGKLIASYARTSGQASSTVKREASLMAFGYDHSLSKRTTVYGTFARISNDGTATFSLNGATGRALPVAGGNSTGYEVGVRHNF